MILIFKEIEELGGRPIFVQKGKELCGFDPLKLMQQHRCKFIDG